MSPNNIIKLNTTPELSENIVARKIADELLLVPIHHTAKNVDSIYTLNETAAFIWECMDGKTAASEIINSVISTFAVTEEEAGADVFGLISDLEKLGFIRC